MLALVLMLDNVIMLRSPFFDVVLCMAGVQMSKGCLPRDWHVTAFDFAFCVWLSIGSEYNGLFEFEDG